MSISSGPPSKRLVKRKTNPVYTAPSDGRETAVTSPKTPKLDPGDAVEFGTTLEIEAGGAKVWLKGGATGHVRPDENGSMAWGRIAKFVQDQLDRTAREYQ